MTVNSSCVLSVGALFLGFAVLTQNAVAAIPDCKDRNLVMSVNNQRILEFKKSTANGYMSRGFVSGVVSRVFPARNSHDHYEIKIGENENDVLEVVYNVAFGETPSPVEGMHVEACGDYITAFAQNGPYPASPSEAIIHWVHYNPKNSGHDHGFVAMDGSLYGWPRNGMERPSRRGDRHRFIDLSSISFDAAEIPSLWETK